MGVCHSNTIDSVAPSSPCLDEMLADTTFIFASQFLAPGYEPSFPDALNHDNIERFRENCKTGDLIYYAHNRNMDKTVFDQVKRQVFVDVLQSPLSHIGFVVRVGKDEIFLTEVIYDNSIWHESDVIDGNSQDRLKGNVRILDFNQILLEFSGDLIWAPAKTPLTKEKEMEVKEFIKMEHARNPEYDTRGLIAAGLKRKLQSLLKKDYIDYDEDLKNYFCSEYVCVLLEVAGILPKETNASIATPGDILELTKVDSHSDTVVIKDVGVVKKYENGNKNTQPAAAGMVVMMSNNNLVLDEFRHSKEFDGLSPVPNYHHPSSPKSA
jgi:hypothetical protein